jgi:hypothetical protein
LVAKDEHRWESLWLLALLGVACRCENILASQGWRNGSKPNENGSWAKSRYGPSMVTEVCPSRRACTGFCGTLMSPWRAKDDELERALYDWGKAVLKARGQTKSLSVSLDGKYLRGSRRARKGERALLLLSVLGAPRMQELGFTLWQEEVSSSEDDSAVRCIAELEGLKGIKWLITGDAGIASVLGEPRITKEVVAKKGATYLL